MTLFKVALKNLLRKKVRSIAIMIAAFLASVMIFGASAIFYSIGRSVQNGVEKLGADIMAVPAASQEQGKRILLSAEPVNFYMDRKNLDGVRAIPGVAVASPQIFVTSTPNKCCGMPAALIVGYDPKTDFTIAPWVVLKYPPWKEHEDLDPVTIGNRLIWAGNTDLRFFGKQFQLGSLLSQTGLALIDYSIFMPIDVVHDMVAVSKTKSIQPLMISNDDISSILIKTGSGFDANTVAREIEAKLPGVKTIVTKNLVNDVRKDVQIAVWGIMAVGLLCWLMMLAIMALVFAMTVNERSREIGILRAMGATKLHVFRLLIAEASLLAGTGAVTGVALCLTILFNFKQLIVMLVGRIQFMWLSPFLLVSLACSCILFITLSGIISALYPAIKTTFKEPYDAIHQGM